MGVAMSCHPSERSPILIGRFHSSNTPKTARRSTDTYALRIADPDLPADRYWKITSSHICAMRELAGQSEVCTTMMHTYVLNRSGKSVLGALDGFDRHD